MSNSSALSRPHVASIAVSKVPVSAFNPTRRSEGAKLFDRLAYFDGQMADSFGPVFTRHRFRLRFRRQKVLDETASFR